ncbi:MAG: SpoIIE family protein phosphatase [Spirochaetales bacterium]|nr:SpoIIE family protein phosphatase [Spirochaetales bacterium]
MNLWRNLARLRPRKSLRFKILSIYGVIALGTIVFFTGLIFENQTDLLTANFRHEIHNLVRSVSETIGKQKVTARDTESFRELAATLFAQNIRAFTVFDDQSRIVFHTPADTNFQLPQWVGQQTQELRAGSALFETNHNVLLDENDFVASAVFRLPAQGKEQLYLHAPLSLATITERLHQIYWQVLIAVLWGLLLNVVFGVFVYRTIFTRVFQLQQATEDVAAGNLTARAVWKRSDDDELDRMGDAFNSMAEKIEETVTAISRMNAEMQQELAFGRDVQESFLPDAATFSHFAPAIIYEPFREVSGDIYGFYKLRARSGGNLHCFFFADATGHGVSAALVTTVILQHLRSAINRSVRPGQVLDQVGGKMEATFQARFNATAVFGVITDSGILYISNAGHLPVMVIGTDGTLRKAIPPGGPVLGVMDQFSYEEERLQLLPGDRIVIYSDGLTEAPSATGQFFGTDRMQDTVVRYAQLPTREMVEHIFQEVKDFCPRFTDDVTLLALSVPE